MRSFFLLFIAVLAAIGNLAIFEQLSPARLIGGLAFNVFVVALLLIWRFAYFATGASRARGLVFAHAAFMLAAGLGFGAIGGNVFSSGSCSSLVSTSSPNGFRNQVVAYLQSLGYCKELGLVLVLFGVLFAYPSIRLFVDIIRRSSGPPSASSEV